MNVMELFWFILREADMNNRKRMIIKALKVSRKYKLTGLDELCVFLFKGWKYRMN